MNVIQNSEHLTVFVTIIVLLHTYLSTVKKHKTLQKGLCNALSKGNVDLLDTNEYSLCTGKSIVDFLIPLSCYDLSKILFYACRGGIYYLANQLKQYLHCNYNCMNEAIIGGHLEIVKLLLSIYLKEKTHQEMFTMACDQGQYHIIEYLATCTNVTIELVHDFVWRHYLDRRELVIAMIRVGAISIRELLVSSRLRL
jgi:hypothetical protein